MQSLGFQLAEDGTRLREYFAKWCEESLPAKLPWGAGEFDLFLAVGHQLARAQCESFASQVVSYNVDWVQIAGCDSQLVHDLVDQAAVASGRQAQVGEGSPMTSWHDDALDPEAMAETAYNCLGSTSRVLCLFIGDLPDASKFVDRLKQLIRQTGPQVLPNTSLERTHER